MTLLESIMGVWYDDAWFDQEDDSQEDKSDDISLVSTPLNRTNLPDTCHSQENDSKSLTVSQSPDTCQIYFCGEVCWLRNPFVHCKYLDEMKRYNGERK